MWLGSTLRGIGASGAKIGGVVIRHGILGETDAGKVKPLLALITLDHGNAHLWSAAQAEELCPGLSRH
jgi:hypothetical protein